MKAVKYILVGMMSVGFVSTMTACQKSEKQKAEDIQKTAEEHTNRANASATALEKYDIKVLSMWGNSADNKDWSKYTPAERRDIRNHLVAVAESCGRLREINRNKDSRTAITGPLDAGIENSNDYLRSLSNYEAANP